MFAVSDYLCACVLLIVIIFVSVMIFLLLFSLPIFQISNLLFHSLVHPEMIVFGADLYMAGIFFSYHKIFELCQPITVKFCTMIESAFDFISPVQNCWWPKACKIWHSFGRLQTLTVNISTMDEDI